MNELEQIVQQMLDEGQPEENINAVIAEYQKSNPDSNVGKTNAVVEETVPAAAEKPVDMGLQSESGSLESPRKSVRKQTRQKELALIADNKQELINNLEEEYYKATSIEDISTKKKNLQQQLKNNFEQGEFKSNERELYEEYLQNPSVDLEIPDETLAEKMQEEFDAKERDFMEDVPEYAQQELKQQLGQRKEEQEASYAQSELEFTDNLNAYEEKVKAINISIDMGVNPTPEEVEELQLNLKDLKERSTDIIAKQSDLNKTKGIYDAFKRSYSDLDMLENTLAKTGIDIALGVNYTLDMLKSEEGKAKSYTKDLINLSQELAKNRQENLAKPVAIGAVSNISQFSEWAGDALINFVPSGIMAASGPAALPLFFTTGYTSRISE